MDKVNDFLMRNDKAVTKITDVVGVGAGSAGVLLGTSACYRFRLSSGSSFDSIRRFSGL